MDERLVLIESNTTGSGREFCAAARDLGLRPVVLTDRPSRYDYLETDAIEAIQCDTSDLEAVLRHCPPAVGVLSSSEYFVAMAARVASALGLPGPDPDALAACRNKDEQRRVLAIAGVPVPGFACATTPSAAMRAALLLGPPVVVKPTTGSGSEGVKLCATLPDVQESVTALLARTVNERGAPIPRRVLVEEYVRGPEFSVECFDGVAIQVVAKHLGAEPYFVEIGHDTPAGVPAENALREVAERAVAALGVGWGATHVELRLTAHGPVIIEVNPRLAGGMIPTLVRLSTGIDLIERVVARATGREPSPPATAVGAASIRFLVAPESGLLQEIHGALPATVAEGVYLVNVTARPGAELTLSHSFRDRLGYVIATGATPEHSGARAAHALSLMKVAYAPVAARC